MHHINTDFYRGIQTNDLEIVQDTLKRGANVHFGNDTPLVISVAHKNLEIMTLLLKNGANINAVTHFSILLSNGGTGRPYVCHASALSCAANNGDANIVRILLEYDVNAKVEDQTALLFSAHRGYTEIVTMLLENGANVHHDDDIALQHSVNCKHIETVAVLLEYGADIHCNDNIILKNLNNNFNEALADALLPYCEEKDYHYFPEEYIRKKFVPTKNATNIISTY